LLASPQALSGDRLGRNKAVWSGIAANPSITIEDLVAQYSRYHFGADLEEDMTGGATLQPRVRHWLTRARL